MRSGDGEKLGPLLDEQAAYYRATAEDYYDHYRDLPGGAELTGALDAFRSAGSVLELACGRGAWTSQLLRHATDVTAADASPGKLAIAAPGPAGCVLRPDGHGSLAVGGWELGPGLGDVASGAPATAQCR